MRGYDVMEMTHYAESREQKPTGKGAEYVHMTLPDGEPVRFKRVWSGHRFTDVELSMLMAGMEIRISTESADGIIGALEWQSYDGHEYYGFSPWDARAYTSENAPVPRRWGDHVFTAAEINHLRKGGRLTLIRHSERSGSYYAVNVSFGIQSGGGYADRWQIIPHFEDFDKPAEQHTRESCVFMPAFGGRILTFEEITALRSGARIPFQGVGASGKPYICTLSLELDTQIKRWRIAAHFNYK